MLSILISIISYLLPIQITDNLELGYYYINGKQELEISIGYKFSHLSTGIIYTDDRSYYPLKFDKVNELGYLYFQVPIKNFYIYNSYGIGSTWDYEFLLGYRYKLIELRTGVGRLDRFIFEIRINLLD